MKKLISLLFILLFVGCALFQTPVLLPCPAHFPESAKPVFVFVENGADMLTPYAQKACKRWGAKKCIYGGELPEGMSYDDNIQGIVPIVIGLPDNIYGSSNGLGMRIGDGAYAHSRIGGRDKCTILSTYIVIPSDLKYGLHERYIAHEIGHALGYEDNITSDPKCVMTQGEIFGDFGVYSSTCIND